MNTDANKRCSECGEPLTGEALLGLCPRCMMKAGLSSSPKATIQVAPDAFVEGPETETKEFTPGTKLGYIGDYELLEEIARGGMGIVYKARQSSLKRLVAVKTIRSGALADEREVQRFRAEAQAAAQLQHPNIVAIHEIGEHQGRHYFSMDFVEGKNLAQVADGKPVAGRTAAEWLKAIAEAVQFAHQRGVLHRDLKPQNVMLDAAGRPRVMDFGLAKTLGRDSTLTNTGAVMGSPSYMSPEQARGLNVRVGPASDVYSLGAILYELLTGRPPFRGKSPVETLSQVVNDEAPYPRSLNRATPMDLEAICLKCLEKDPMRRYPTARELESDLGRFLDGDPVQARPADALRRAMSWLRRHRWVLNALVSVLLLTLAGLAYGFWEKIRSMAWHNAHPGAVKPPVPWGVEFAFLHFPGGLGGLLVMGAIGALIRLFLTTIQPVKKAVSRFAQTRVPALAALVAAAPLVLHLILIAVALSLAADCIHNFVWNTALPLWFQLCIVFVLFYSGVAGLMRLAREQVRIPVDPPRENKPEPPVVLWLLLGSIILAGGLWMLSGSFSKADLLPFVGGLAVAGSTIGACFALSRLSGSSLRGDLLEVPSGWKRDETGALRAESSDVAVWKRACCAMWRWIRAPARIAIAALAILVLVINACVLLAGLSSFSEHGLGLFFTGILFGLLLWPLARTWKPRKPRAVDKPAPLSQEQLAPIHEAIFAGRSKDAFKLYHAAMRLNQGAQGDRANSRILDQKIFWQMEAELVRAHPEKFSAEALNRRTRQANRGQWLWWGFILLVGLLLLYFPQAFFRPELVFIGLGLVFGASIRGAVSVGVAGWRKKYRSMSRVLKLGAWFLFIPFSFGVVSGIYGLLVHPAGALDPLFDSFVGGLLVGGLWVHLWLKRRKTS